MNYYTVEYDKLLAFVYQCFQQEKFSSDHAKIAAHNLVNADLRGIDSHGVARLSGYLRLIAQNRINPQAEPKIIRETPSTATIDADKALGLVSGEMAMKIAIKKAKTAGTGWVAVGNSNHFGIASNFAMMALEEDMIGIAMTNASALVAPTYSKQRMLGTNPICYAFPSGKEAPFVADFATTTAANGKLEILQRQQKNTPSGWVQDAEGMPSQDAHILKNGGALLPLGGDYHTGGHKGYALGSIVDILTGVLSGASFGPWAPPFPAYVPMPENMPGQGLGHFFGAMRIDAFQDADKFKNRMDLWLNAFRNAQPIDPAQTTLIPGDMERIATAKRLEEGIPLIENVYHDLQEIAKKHALTLD